MKRSWRNYHMKKGFMLGEDSNKEEKSKSHDDDRKKPSDTVNRANNRIYFYSDIDRDSALRLITEMRTAEKDMLKEQIDFELETPRPIYLHIYSYGGWVHSGLAIVDSILTSKVPIYSVVEGYAASAATLVSVVAKKRFINKHARFLIHEVSGAAWGKLTELKDSTKNAEGLMDAIKKIYQEHSKMPKAIMEDLCKHDLDLTPEQCLKYGFVDKII
jgi:ATP-dependent Clp protease, protease subunit